MMKLLRKSLFIIAMMCGLSLVIVSCGNNTSNTEATEPTADEDGNIDVEINIKDSALHGTMSRKWKKDEISNKEKRIIAKTEDILSAVNIGESDKGFECIYGDIDSDLSVWSLMSEKDNEVADYHGIIIRYNNKDYKFAEIYHGKNPVATYEEKAKKVYVSCDVVEGTNVHTEVLYAFDIKNDDVKYITLLDPYDVQEYFKDQIKYDVKQNDVIFKIKNRVASKIEGIEDGEGVFKSLAVGEQISYEFDDDNNIRVNVVPGIKFAGGANLYYEDSPTFSADVKYKNNKFELNAVKVIEE